MKSHEHLKFIPASKFVLELALQIVRLQGKKSIDTEHLLWGLVCLADTNQTGTIDLFQGCVVDRLKFCDRLAETV